MKSICVFCGSSMGNDPDFEKAARSLGQKLAEMKISLVYGGAKVGLMGTLASGCKDAGGHVIGVIPHFLDKIEVTNTLVDELHQTTSMHDRKKKMSELAEGFIALPGGYGTMDELCEIMTWSQLGLVKRPIGLLNVKGYYDHLISLFDHMSQKGLIKSVDANLLIHDTDIDALLKKMLDYVPSTTTFMDKLNLT